MKTNRIHQHRPACFEGFENETVEFDTKEELFAIPWVANFAFQPDFVKFSIDPDVIPCQIQDRWLLMAEYKGGTVWWVVGYLDKLVDLPKWAPAK